MENYNVPVGNNAKETPIIEVLSRELDKQFAELTEVVKVLESRLSSVMRDAENAVDNTTLAPQIQGRSVFSAMLGKKLDETEMLCKKISSIIRRLEI